MLDSAQLVLRLEITRSGELGHTSVYKAKVLDKEKGHFEADSLTLSAIGDDQWSEWMQNHSGTFRARVGFVKKMEKARYSSEHITGFVDQDMNAWEIVLMEAG